MGNHWEVECQSEYGKIRIQESMYSGQPAREMMINGGYETAIYTDKQKRNEPVFEYVQVMATLYQQLNESHQAKNVLVIGGGGYAFPRYLVTHDPLVSVDVVEIDPMVTQMAREYLYLEEIIRQYGHRLRLITADGRRYVEETKEHYDFVICDAFSGAEPIAGLVTREALQAFHTCLNPNGICMINVICSLEGPRSRFLYEEHHTMQSVFEDTLMIPCPTFLGEYLSEEKIDRSQLRNVILLGCDQPVPKDVICLEQIEISSQDEKILKDAL